MTAVESERSSLTQLRPDVSSVNTEIGGLVRKMTILESSRSEGAAAVGMADKIRVLEARCEDPENKLRREDIISYGLPYPKT